MLDTSLFLKSESGLRNICKLYVLSSKGTKFHPGYRHLQEITIEIKSFAIWHGGVGDSRRLQHLESPGSIPSRALFSRRGWVYLSADLTKGSFEHFSSFYVIIILKTSKIPIFCMFLKEYQIASNM